MRSGTSWAGALTAGICLFVLAGCQQEGADLGIATAQPRVQAPGVPIAFESLDGGPDATRNQLWSALASEAAVRRIELVTVDQNPRFRIRGYVDAQAGEDGKTALAYVWDVYDTTKKRAQRIQGTAPIRAGASDPWSGVDASAVRRTASQSLDDIAGFLVAQSPSTGNQPTVASNASTVDGRSVKPLGFAAE